MATSRLVSIWQEMNESKLPFDEWVLLESIARRVERRIVERHAGVGTLPLDQEQDGLSRVGRDANAALTKHQIDQEKTMPLNQPPPERLPLEQASTVDLVKEVFDEAKELVRLEVEIAKDEVKQEVAQAKKAAIGFGVAFVFTVVAVCLLAVALVLAAGATAVVALAVAGGFLVLGGIAGYLGFSMIPKKPLDKTVHRAMSNVNQLKEHIA
jgi:hypothetical protein